MRLFVSGATAAVRRHFDPDALGLLLVPTAGNRPRDALALGLPWAVDNLAFSGFDPAAFCTLLGKVAGHPGCAFVALPDVVGDAAATLVLFRDWRPVVRALGLPPALVAQDGLTPDAVPWGDLAAVFVGGSTAWKLGPDAAAVVREAKRRGLHVHMGRVNSKGRFRYAHHLGCDSVDGSGFSRWPDQRIPLAVRWLADLDGRAKDNPPVRDAARRFFAGPRGLVAGPGWRVAGVEVVGGRFVVHADLAADPVACPRCGSVTARPPEKHGTRAVTVLDAPAGGVPVAVRVRRRRYRCRACRAVFAQPLPGVAAGVRPLATRGLLAYLAARPGVPARRLAAAVGADRDAVRRWLRAAGRTTRRRCSRRRDDETE